MRPRQRARDARLEHDVGGRHSPRRRTQWREPGACTAATSTPTASPGESPPALHCRSFAAYCKLFFHYSVSLFLLPHARTRHAHHAQHWAPARAAVCSGPWVPFRVELRPAVLEILRLSSAKSHSYRARCMHWRASKTRKAHAVASPTNLASAMPRRPSRRPVRVLLGEDLRERRRHARS